jgi:uroporphyrin-III C-methyltransferase
MTVYLVGAGPGDPDLITVRGARLLAAADVVVHDRLAAPLISLANPGARLFDVGKARGSAPVPQSEINALLVDLGQHNDCVVRLKGGDPMVLARGTEEAEALIHAGVPFAVVPGISSVLGAPAAAGISLTIRGVAQSFLVFTGHEEPGALPDERWRAMAEFGGTLVILMGAKHIARTATRLVAAGLAPETPVAAVYAASTSQERVVISSLAEIGRIDHPSPTMFIVGDVVRRRVVFSPGAFAHLLP